MSTLFRLGLLLYKFEEPTTAPPTTAVPTTVAPTTLAPTTLAPTTLAPTTLAPTTLAPTTPTPTTLYPTTVPPSTLVPTTLAPTTVGPTTIPPTTEPPPPYCLTLTIPSGTVGTNLTDFPVMVRLSDLGNHFWNNVKADGGDIRVKELDYSQLPQDLVRFDYQSKDGVIFFKASLLSGSDNIFRICYGDPGLDKLAVDDANGRNAVWSDYESVLLYGESAGDDRTGKDMGKFCNDPAAFEIIETSSVDVNSHQGVCWDGTYYYTIDTNAIRKWDSSWSLIDTNSDPIGDSSIVGVNHCGDACYHSGNIYIPMLQNDDAPPPYDNQHIAVFAASDLSFVTSFDISAQAHETAGICYCDRDGLLYIVDYTDGDTLYKYDPADGSYEGTLVLDRKINESQGIAWWRDYFWITGDLNDEIFRVSYAGEVSTGNVVPEGTGGIFGLAVSGGNLEGIGNREEDLIVLADPGATERVDVYKPIDMDVGAGGGLRTIYSGYVKADGRASFTTFTIGVTVIFETIASNQTPLSYWEDGSANTRANFGYSTTYNNFNIYDSSGNGSLRPTPAVAASEDVPYRLHMQYSGTSFRKLFIDGDEKASQSGILSCPASLDTILAGIEDETLAEPFTGLIGFVYLRDEILSADWIEAEYSNVSDPSNFYEIDVEYTTAVPTTVAATTTAPTTLAPTTVAPSTVAPTTEEPTTLAPSTQAPSTLAPTTAEPTTTVPTTLGPTTTAPTTSAPTTLEPTTLEPTTLAPTTLAPTTVAPTTVAPTTLVPTTHGPTTAPPTTLAPTTLVPTTPWICYKEFESTIAELVAFNSIITQEVRLRGDICW